MNGYAFLPAICVSPNNIIECLVVVCQVSRSSLDEYIHFLPAICQLPWKGLTLLAIHASPMRTFKCANIPQSTHPLIYPDQHFQWVCTICNKVFFADEMSRNRRLLIATSVLWFFVFAFKYKNILYTMPGI